MLDFDLKQKITFPATFEVVRNQYFAALQEARREFAPWDVSISLRISTDVDKVMRPVMGNESYLFRPENTALVLEAQICLQKVEMAVKPGTKFDRAFKEELRKFIEVVEAKMPLNYYVAMTDLEVRETDHLFTYGGFYASIDGRDVVYESNGDERELSPSCEVEMAAVLIDRRRK